MNSMRLQLIVDVVILLATGAASTLVHLGGDGVSDVGQLLLLLLEVLSGGVSAVLLEPLVGLLDSVEDLEYVSMFSLVILSMMGKLTVSFSSSSILPPRPSSSLTWFLREKA